MLGNTIFSVVVLKHEEQFLSNNLFFNKLIQHLGHELSSIKSNLSILSDKFLYKLKSSKTMDI